MTMYVRMKGTKYWPLLLWACLLTPLFAKAQNNAAEFTQVPLNDMSAFKPAAKNWAVAADVVYDRSGNAKATKISSGKGVLVNQPTDKEKDNLVSNFEHGDVELDLEFMMAKGSNSGIYLQGRYELQLLDSWGVQNPRAGDCGGIYERWDDSKPEGQKGFEGYAPRMNVSRAPGLWQHFNIVFQAPRFDASGNKIQNARFVKVIHNGVLIHENVELTGPTRGPAFPGEKATGPIVIQGDHGPVAFRNIKYRSVNVDNAAQANTNRRGARPQIYLKPGNEPLMHRSFVDFQKEPSAKAKRITHAISVGEPSGVHYTMDLGTGALVQVWKGGFLDATPMWHDRGDGSARASGSVVRLSDAPTVAYLADKNATWPATFEANTFRPKGYDIDATGRPVFKYLVNGTEVTDRTFPEEEGKVLTREIKINGQKQGTLYCRIAEGTEITSLQDGTYTVDGKAFYVKVGDTGGAKPEIRNAGNRKELVVPIEGKSTGVKYSLIW
ncbi:DUF1080 domain-containing protein [Rhodocytophaga aerolata]|uniref:DUF1080 domain-containing protein n=1 Tax=Rhodocytophaga aerolata TaxID=455078 RepID=A0ABT8R6P6_9BACT|nr:DUF1080 domain-containing protein [Rhodocytophaga aerolata]MDO1446878.1 DUF1080 domain-containing protein [Rhodocytophaga aerolata]